MMLKLRVVLFILLVLFPLTTLQLDADRPVERDAENKQDLHPDERTGFMLSAVGRRCCSHRRCTVNCHCCRH
nr:TPA_inf: conotoxin precursor M [Conus ebraeus]